MRVTHTVLRPARHGWKALGVALFLAPQAAHAQDVIHPRDFPGPGSVFVMPDTSRFRFVMQNGLMGFAIPDLSTPIVTMSAFVRVGTADGPPGAAELIEMMFRTRGPCFMAPGRYEEAMDRTAATLTVSVGAELSEITLHVTADDVDEGYRLFSGIVRAPCIDTEGLEAFRASVRARRMNRTREGVGYSGSLAEAVELFHEDLYGEHAYGSTSVEEADRLNLDDIEDFLTGYVNPPNTTIAVSGPFPPDQMVAGLDERFADWAPDRAPRLRGASGLDQRDAREQIHYPADKLQTWIVIGHELEPVRPADWPALQVMNYILGGGHFDTRLFREGRDKRGLTNDASGFLNRMLRGPGTYTFQTSGRPEVAQQLIDIVFREIDRIQTDGVTDEELALAQGALAHGAFPLMFESGHSTARTFALEWARWGSMDHLAEYVRRIERVSTNDVRRAADRYLHPERMLVVTMGPAIN